MTHPVPDAALDDRLGFVGTAGSGKTYNAGGCVERLLATGARVVIIDPLDVWWGLRLRADGVTPSPHAIVIFGGAHGDLPLTEHAGALIGEAVAGTRESCIVSLGALGTKAAERRFMLAFLTALYRLTPGEPLHLVFDEADMWAPERVLDKEGEANKLLGQMETIVRRGRVKGFIPWLISQRPAVLSKNVLSQVDGLVAFKLTASQDRRALGAWIEGQADVEQGRKILASLPTMQRGQGVVWVPGRNILATVSFPAKVTFDSSRTPKRGERAVTAQLAALDIGALRARLSTIEAETAANDPKVLRAEIAKMRGEVATLRAQVAAGTASPQAIAAAREEGRLTGFDEGQREGLRIGQIQGRREAAERLRGTINATLDEIVRESAEAGGRIAVVAPETRPPPAPTVQLRAMTERELGGMPLAERRFLTALAQRGRSLTRNQIAIFAGYTVTSRHVDNTLAALRSKGLVQGTGSAVQITADGMLALGPFELMPKGEALRAYWIGELPKAEGTFLRILMQLYPVHLGRNELAERAGYSPQSRHVDNTLARLRSYELVTRGRQIRAAADLFEE